MKKILANIIFIAVLAGGGYYLYENYIADCRYPIEYSVGSFDGRFGITETRFLSTITEAEKIWEKAAGVNLFNYQPGSDFKINLVYDERQEVTEEAKESEEEIEGTRELYDSLLGQYESLKALYDRRLAEYDNAVNSYEDRLASYNAKVEFYNKKGGAPKNEYDELQREAGELNSVQEKLDSERSKLNIVARELNALGEQVNQLAKKFNIEVDIHNEQFGEAREFDQGDYQGDKINIYQFENISDLRLVLAHELGHSLGIGHVENAKSIMYYLMEKQNLSNPLPTTEDIVALKKVCKI